MWSVNDCFSKVKKDCFKFISSQETKKDKFKNKEKMIKITEQDTSSVSQSKIKSRIKTVTSNICTGCHKKHLYGVSQ